MWKRRLTLGAVLGVLLLTFVGCSSGGSDPPADEAADGSVSTTTTTAPVPTAPSLIVTARDYAFDDLPPEIEGGVLRMTFENKGERKHSAVIVGIGETPTDQARQELAQTFRGEGKPISEGLRFSGGVSLVEGGTSWAATVSLPPGKYVMACPLTVADTLDPTARPPDPNTPTHFDRGMMAEFRVDRTNTAVMPPTDGTVTARDWSYEVPPLPTGLRTLTFRNDGQQPHSLTIAELPGGVDAAAPGTGVEVAYAALDPGGQTTVSLMLKVNRTYVFACYLADRAGGPLHATGRGMITSGTVPAG